MGDDGKCFHRFSLVLVPREHSDRFRHREGRNKTDVGCLRKSFSSTSMPSKDSTWQINPSQKIGGGNSPTQTTTTRSYELDDKRLSCSLDSHTISVSYPLIGDLKAKGKAWVIPLHADERTPPLPFRNRRHFSSKEKGDISRK